jgi:hypothetical protein
MRRVAATAVATFAALLLMAAPTRADCSRAAPSANILAYRGLAFTATIAGIDRRSISDPYDVTFEIDHVFAGAIAGPLVARDVGGDCGAIRPSEMKVGQRVFVAADQLNEYASGGTFGDVLLWREAEGGTWRFFAEALWAGQPDREYYPPEAWKATSLDEIIALVAPGAALPDTSEATTPARLLPGPLPELGLALATTTAVIAAAGFTWRRRRATSTRPPPAGAVLRR